MALASGVQVVGFDTEAFGPIVIKPDKTTFLDVPQAQLAGYSVASDLDPGGTYYPVDHCDLFPAPTPEEVRAHWDSIFGDPGIIVVCHNLPFDLAVVYNYYPEIQIRARLVCTLAVGGMLQKSLGGKKGLKLKWLRVHELGLPERDNFGQVTKGRAVNTIPVAEMLAYASADASDTRLLFLRWWPELERLGGSHIWWGIEAPTSEVVEHMARVGLPLDYLELAQADTRLKALMRQRESEWYGRWGCPIGSDQAVADRMVPAVWPPQRRTKTGKYSVDSDMMDKAARTAPTEVGRQAARVRIEYAEMKKLQSAFTEGLVQTAVQYGDRRLHPAWHQCGTLSGRYSVSDPNVAQLPMPAKDSGEWIPNIKGAIRASKDYRILAGDYSQIELRLAAHLSGDPLWAEAYHANIDVHQQTAEAVGCNRNPDAKIYNFRLLYGGTAWAVALELEIPYEEADAKVDAFWRAHPVLRAWLLGCWDWAKTHGVVYTIAGRPVKIPRPGTDEYHKLVRKYVTEYKLRPDKAEQKVVNHLRNRAGNAPIQGSNADITKTATINVFRLWQRKGWIQRTGFGLANIIANEHDSIVCEVHDSIADEAQSDLKMTMESAWRLNVPLLADVRLGATWAEAKGK